MDIFAYYLPQFHEIVENDEWHGKGFTEWTNVKAAKPLYKEHLQPIRPQAGDYYNLLEKETVSRQVSLAKSYGIDGFVYYHYWFNGRLLMEKPVQNFLKWKDINHRFYFCWANHSFYNKWDGSNKLLLEQTYGKEDDWKVHFEYLLEFFGDDRYLKIDGKPVFAIFDGGFTEKTAMIECFNRLCIENGFSGIYALELCKSDDVSKRVKDNHLCNMIYHMPSMGMVAYDKKYWLRNICKKAIRKILRGCDINTKIRYQWYTGDEILRAYLESEYPRKADWASLFFAWDNTPRYGKNGFVISHISKEMAFEYLDAMKDKTAIVINAWNEWAEGMILEQSEEYGCRDLQLIKEWRESRNV